MEPTHAPRYARHRFPAEVISHAIWLYVRFPLSLRMVEEMLAARGILVSHEGTVAVTWTRLNEPCRTGRSGRKTEELIDETDFACRLTFPLDAMTAAHHPHDFKTLQGRRGGFHRLEAARRSDYALERAMIRLNDVIQRLRGAVLHVLRQQPFVLQA
jgi:hypothetical protein